MTYGKGGLTIVRGILGVHVDDGMGGGDSCFHETLKRLRKIYDFGAYNEGEFEFCGVRYRQRDDGTIEMDQVEYLKKVEPIEIPRKRRMTPNEDLNAIEVQHLRRLCGSLQYAAAAKVGSLQSIVTRGKVQHLKEASRVLFEGKKHSVCLVIVPYRKIESRFAPFLMPHSQPQRNCHPAREH